MTLQTPYAVIDIGSNSLRLMTGTIGTNGQWQFSPKTLATTKLGNHMEETRHLWPEGMEASFAAMDSWHKQLQGLHVCAIATSAVREAVDGQAFLAEIRARYGWHCRCIPGAEEAELSFCGAASAVGPDVTAAVLDIGGGSSELALGKDREVTWSHSYPLGAVRLTKQKTWSKDDVENLKKRCLQTLLPTHTIPDVVIGVGGTLTTLAAMDMKMTAYDPKKVEGYVLTKETIAKWIDAIQQMTPEERKQVPGLQVKRSDIILPGLVIAWSFLEYYQQSSLKVSERDSMEGVFYKHAFYDAARRVGDGNAWT